MRSTLSSSPESLLANKSIKSNRNKISRLSAHNDRPLSSFVHKRYQPPEATRDTEPPKISLVASSSDLSGNKHEEGGTMSRHSRSPGYEEDTDLEAIKLKITEWILRGRLCSNLNYDLDTQSVD